MLCSVSPSDRLSVVFAATKSSEEVTSNSVELLISVSYLTDSIMSRQKDQSPKFSVSALQGVIYLDTL